MNKGEKPHSVDVLFVVFLAHHNYFLQRSSTYSYIYLHS